MDTEDIYVESTLFDGCLYGDDQSVFFFHHCFSLIIALSIGSMLLFNVSLRKFYTPLAKIVNAAICLQCLRDFLFFFYYPYAVTDGNCGEMLIGRLYIGCVMFGELHQIYLLANMLNMGSHKFKILDVNIAVDTLLNLLFFGIVVSMAYSTIVYHSFTMIRNLWCILVCLIQLYFIRSHRLQQQAHSKEEEEKDKPFSPIVNSVRIYEKLSILQLLPAVLCFLERALYLIGMDLIPHFGTVALILDVFCDFLFYLKVLLITENSEVVKVDVSDV